MTLHVEIITPEKLLLSDDVDFLAAPTSDGEIGVLPRHTPLLTKLGNGELRLKKGNEIKVVALCGGFLEVMAGSQVAVFAETAELADEIDEERARLAAERAKEKLQKGRTLPDVDLIDAEASLERALTRLKVVRLRHGRIQRQGVR